MMRFSPLKILALLMVLGPVAAQASQTATIAEHPSCAAICFDTAITDSPCKGGNSTCICTTDSLQLQLSSCVQEKCSVIEALSAKNATLAACNTPVRKKSDVFIAICDPLAVIAGIFVMQRLFYKLYWKNGLTVDDWFTLAAMLSAIAIQVIANYGTIPNGMGRDMWTLTPHSIRGFLKHLWPMEILYFLQVMLIKNALLFFYLHLFQYTTVRWLLWGTICLNTVGGLLFVFLSIFQCTPRSYFWTSWDKEGNGKCLDFNAITWANAVMSISLDIWVLAIPIWQLKNLHLNWKKKICAGMMFSVGVFVTIVSILRLRSLVDFSQNSENPTWDYQDIALWSIIEIDVAIVCVCMPTFRLLLSHIPWVQKLSLLSNGGGSISQDRPVASWARSITLVSHDDANFPPMESDGIKMQTRSGRHASSRGLTPSQNEQSPRSQSRFSI